MPVISVIVPVYKVEPYLRRCVDSILSQTFTDFELILVDDGSPDLCHEICDEYAIKDKRVYVIHQKNGGLSAARNAGLDYIFENSNSEWVTFIDSDDWVHPLYLEALYQSVTSAHVKISITGFQKTSKYFIDLTNDTVDFDLINSEKFFVEQRTNAVIACGKLYRKECFHSIRYPVGKIHEDEFVTYKVLFACPEVAVTNQQLYYYYINPEGIMNSKWNPKRMSAIDAIEEQMLFLKKRGFSKAYLCDLICLLKLLYRYTEITEDSNLVQFFKKKMQRLLLCNIMYFSFCSKKASWCCEYAFPLFMRFYWPISSKLKQLASMIEKK